MYSMTMIKLIDVLKILEPSHNYHLLQPINQQSLSEFDLETDVQYSLQISLPSSNLFREGHQGQIYVLCKRPIGITFIINLILVIRCAFANSSNI